MEQGVDSFRAFHDEQYTKPADLKTGEPEQWSYQGLHMLKNGDYLTVFSKTNPRRKIWSGKLRLRDLRVKGRVFVRIAFQFGVDPGKWWLWFEDEYPATLIPARARRSKPKSKH